MRVAARPWQTADIRLASLIFGTPDSPPIWVTRLPRPVAGEDSCFADYVIGNSECTGHIEVETGAFLGWLEVPLWRCVASSLVEATVLGAGR